MISTDEPSSGASFAAAGAKKRSVTSAFTRRKSFSASQVRFAASFPPGYEEAIVYNLAERMCVAWAKPIGVELELMARRARAKVQSLNSVAPKLATADAGMPGSGSRRSFNYRTGGF